MKQSIIGLLIFVILTIPPVVTLFESIMIIHMHMQIPLLILSGFLMERFLKIKFPQFFKKWNCNGVPGILLFVLINIYWMLPRTMDEALTVFAVEVFKFISLPFLAGISLRDSWNKLRQDCKMFVYVLFIILFIGMGLLYIYAPAQLCNNYLLTDQITLGWGFLMMAICMVIYLLYQFFIDHSAYEGI